jgi:5'-phosphate synthase pdxT subunit
MILLAQTIVDGTPDQRSFGAIDIDVRRNAYGRQVDSFEMDIDVEGLTDPFHAMFIRAPQIVRCGSQVRVLASMEQDAVLVRQGPVFVASFHPELTPDDRLHRLFLRSLSEV